MYRNPWHKLIHATTLVLLISCSSNNTNTTVTDQNGTTDEGTTDEGTTDGEKICDQCPDDWECKDGECVEPDCHVDCFGQTWCEDGTVKQTPTGPAPCELGLEACDEVSEILSCEHGCAEGEIGDPSNPEKHCAPPPADDKDLDGIIDEEDNCPDVANKEQNDCDDDGMGDACDNDADNDEVLNEDDNCLCVPNPAQLDTDKDNQGDKCDNDDDNDGYSDFEDEFPLDAAEWADFDKDGTGNNEDTDDDNDGLSDEEEMQWGKDCSLTDPSVADTDNDGVGDASDAYPNDPFPAFVLIENPKGGITVVLSKVDPMNATVDFGESFEVGQSLGHLCAAPDNSKLCSPTCAMGTFCQMGVCVEDEPKQCDEACAEGQVCRKRLYRSFSIGDFKTDGKMDFLAHSYPADPDGTYQLWFFERLEESGNFPQQYLGQVKQLLNGVVADVDGNFLFDIVVRKADKPNYLANIYGTTYLGNGVNSKTNCAVGPVEEGCAFTAVENAWDIKKQVAGQWGSPAAREAQEMTGDEFNDLIFATYASGGNDQTKVYLLPSNGDGTFATAEYKFSHNKTKKQGPANSILFADFNGDKIGDVLMGLDDDGDAGSAWLYTGKGDGSFNDKGKKVFDLNPGCNSNCGEKPGHSGNAKAFDFNFDGAMDVILGYNFKTPWLPPSKLVVLVNNGDGTFKDAQQIGPTYNGSEAKRFQSPQRLCPFYND